MKLNVLGVEYEIIQNASVERYPKLKRVDGYTDFSIKQIVVADFEKDDDSVDNLEQYKRKVLRHEIVHAFIYESGLAENSDWARNEEMTDWIAIQFEKLLSAFKNAKAIDSDEKQSNLEVGTLNKNATITNQDYLVNLIG